MVTSSPAKISPSLLIGANEASVHAVLPLIQRFREAPIAGPERGRRTGDAVRRGDVRVRAVIDVEKRALRALAPRIKYCTARGPAPQVTHFFTESEASSDFGRVLRTIATAAGSPARGRRAAA